MKRIEKERGAQIEEVLREMYVDRKMTIEAIAFELNIAYVTAFQWIKFANISSRGFNME